MTWVFGHLDEVLHSHILLYQGNCRPRRWRACLPEERLIETDDKSACKSTCHSRRKPYAQTCSIHSHTSILYVAYFLATCRERHKTKVDRFPVTSKARRQGDATTDSCSRRARRRWLYDASFSSLHKDSTPPSRFKTHTRIVFVIRTQRAKQCSHESAFRNNTTWPESTPSAFADVARIKIQKSLK